MLGALHVNLKRIIIGLGAVLLISIACTGIGYLAWGVFVASIFTSGDIPHKSDEELIANFKTHEAEFNQLRDMIMADKYLYRVDYNWTKPEDPKTIGVSDERIATYRKMFVKLGIPRGFYFYPDSGEVKFLSSAQGLSVSGSSKSYVWLKQTPSGLVDSIDTHRTKPGATYPVYRHITGNWYLEFDAD
jgi:hypothetical protein